jgi:bacillithiol system protein YtxJ
MQANLRELHNVEEFDQALRESNDRLVMLFKHSVTCPISARAFREFNSHIEQSDPRVSYNLITVQKARFVSNEAAARLGVQHETPQAILIRNGQQVWNASHFSITVDSLEDAIRRSKD